MAFSSKVMLVALALATFTVHVECQLAEPVEDEDMTEQQKADKADRAEAAKVILAADLTDYGFWPGVFMNIGKQAKKFFAEIGSSISSFLEKLMNNLLGMFGGGSSTNSLRGTETIEVVKKEESAADQVVDDALEAADIKFQEAESAPAPKEITNSFDTLNDDANNREVTVEDVVEAAKGAKEEWDSYVTDMMTPGSFVQVRDRFESPHRQSKRRKGVLTTQALIQDSE
eukprot:gnl/MRDRNA2_/MRDRNA2_32701_c0_seq1.p1 gnl/MRDRNA2_/MRDRNA2_32701_c0~~gnl/MRDRNA2_/MRDRNA2_32701_c0_seq1.p1  ORF type:complete len:229 (+),score=61.14 gnl/MRDRNA2_/MRDRNA2_32701_c0_seq1:99-785(+)